MTPEEFDTRMQFILDSQAQFAVRQERDHELLVQGFQIFTQNTGRFQSYATDLIAIQSDRMDRMDKFYSDFLTQNQEFQRQVVDLQRQAFHLLNLILDRLPPA
jgi:hypothetical protein